MITLGLGIAIGAIATAFSPALYRWAQARKQQFILWWASNRKP